MKSRRAFVQVGAAAVLGGCVGSSAPTGARNRVVRAGRPADEGADEPTASTARPDRDGDGVPDDDDDLPDDPEFSRRAVVVDETRWVGAGERYDWTFDRERLGSVAYEFTVHEGPPVDVLVLAAGEFDYFRGGKRFRYYETASVANATEGRAEVTLGPGEYHVVVDTTGRIGTPPAEGGARVGMFATATR